MAMRGVYEWFVGIKPCLDGLELQPCIPDSMMGTEVMFEYLNKNYIMKLDERGITLNGKKVTDKRNNAYFIALEQLKNYEI